MKQIKPFKLSLVELPIDTQVIRYFIKQELNRRLFNILAAAGLDGYDYQPHFDSLIMRRLGLADGNDEAFDCYYEIVERRSQRIVANQASTTRHAFEIYAELVNLKQRLEEAAK